MYKRQDIGYYDDILPQKYGFEEMRVKKYDVGDSFDTHVDVSDYASARRWLAFLVYLNDNFTGGETEFVDGKMIHPKTGSVLVFPSLWTFPHAGLPVKSGTKYILTTYFHYISMDRIEKVILRNLVYNEEYLRKVIPFIEPDYFNDRNERVVFEHITKYVAEYNNLITKEVLLIEIEDRRDITQEEVKNLSLIHI